jgi:hypothetical protein
MSCSDDDNHSGYISNCDVIAQKPERTYFNQIDTSNYTITDVQLSGDCLEVSISASGCDANTWDINLFGVDSFFNSTIPGREMKVELINTQTCLTVISKTISFDLLPYQEDNIDALLLIIESWSENVIYDY